MSVRWYGRVLAICSGLFALLALLGFYGIFIFPGTGHIWAILGSLNSTMLYCLNMDLIKKRGTLFLGIQLAFFLGVDLVLFAPRGSVVFPIIGFYLIGASLIATHRIEKKPRWLA